MDPRQMVRSMYPYAEKYGVLRAMPERGLSSEAILAQMRETAESENALWEGGKCSGSLYCGDHAHYAMMNECYALFSHTNAIQRDICPSMNRFESEIIAMTLDMLGAGSVTATKPGGAVTSGGTESILTAMLTYRDHARAERGINEPEMICPLTAHSAFRKAAHLFGYKVVHAPVDSATGQVDVDFVRSAVTKNTVVIIGSAGNYAYGTIDPIEALSGIALEAGCGLHVDGCLGGFILPWGRALGYDIAPFDFTIPGVTTISADTHKYGYALKGTSVIAYRDKNLRRYQYYMEPTWKGGAYMSQGLLGSRSGGLIAATWASMVHLGREGYMERARRIFEASFAMQKAVLSHPELLIIGRPSFCFSFRSEVFNIYHVNDFMKTRGWRFNGQQDPDAIHMCVTGPQTREGLPEVFARDLADAVVYARNPPQPKPKSDGVYGLSGLGLDLSQPAMARMVLGGAMDAFVESPT